MGSRMAFIFSRMDSFVANKMETEKRMNEATRAICRFTFISSTWLVRFAQMVYSGIAI